MQTLNTHSLDTHSSRSINPDTGVPVSLNSGLHSPRSYIGNSLHQHLADATGPIDFPFTNDYIFRAALQKDAIILKGLICSMLHMYPDEIKSLIITNPITLGQHIDNKEFILDISLILNDDTHIDLEMQVKNEGDWNDRSLSYLCRNFDQLSKGEDYTASGTAIHIGFLDFSPFPDAPEFYATYKLLNVKNCHPYTSKFVLNVLDLTHIELATEEDKTYGIDAWARLFKARTWEDLKMIAKQNSTLQQASETLYTLNCDQTIRDMARAREDAIRHENRVNKLLAEKDACIAEQSMAISEMKTSIAEKDASIAKLNTRLAKLESLLANSPNK